MEYLVAAEISEIDIFEEILDGASTAEFVVRIVEVDTAMLRNFEFSPTSVFCVFHLECERSAGKKGCRRTDPIV